MACAAETAHQAVAEAREAAAAAAVLRAEPDAGEEEVYGVWVNARTRTGADWPHFMGVDRHDVDARMDT